MEHLISKRLTNVKKLSAFEKASLADRKLIDTYKKANRFLEYVILGVSCLTALHFANQIFSIGN